MRNTRMSEGLANIGEPLKDAFSRAMPKGEGMMVDYGVDMMPSKPQRETTWIEFSLPVEWEDECWSMIEHWLKEKRRSEK